MHNKKAQSAMEYLMTYGWAILVVLIALGALYYLGVFNPKVPNVCLFNAPFSCIGGDVGIAEGAVETVATFKLGVIGVSATPAPTITSVTGDFITAQCSPVSPLTLTPGTETKIECKKAKAELPKGKSVHATFKVSYSSLAGISHTTEGSISGSVE